MWKKGLVLLFVLMVVSIIASLVLDLLLNAHNLDNLLTFAFAGVFAWRANVDYYKYKVLGDRGWW
jgi:hypothetical protein